MEVMKGKTTRAQQRGSTVSTKLHIIAEKARNNPKEVFTSVSHLLNQELLSIAWQRTRKSGSTGVDGKTAAKYAENLEGNLRRLEDQARSGNYKAPPVRRGYIPKPGTGKVRPIGVPTIEDKVLQRAAVIILNAIYEQDFLDCSHGFRPGRSAHTALQALWSGLMQMRGGWIYEVDIKSFFDTIDPKQLRKILDRRVRDGILRKLLDKWLKAGVMEEGKVHYDEQGTPQGGVVSPMLANIFLHEVLDVWFTEVVKPRLKGPAFLVRFADDFVIVFKNKRDALRVMEVVPKRLAKYGLAISQEKTRLIEFNRPRLQDTRKKKSDEYPITFDFLGFTHYWGKNRKGKWVVARKTANVKFKLAIARIYEWCKKNRHVKKKVQYKKLRVKLLGHYSYYGITGNYKSLSRFLTEVVRIWYKWLNRRSQRRSYNWKKFKDFLKHYKLPRPRVVHSVFKSAANP